MVSRQQRPHTGCGDRGDAGRGGDPRAIEHPEFRQVGDQLQLGGGVRPDAWGTVDDLPVVPPVVALDQCGDVPVQLAASAADG